MSQIAIRPVFPNKLIFAGYFIFKVDTRFQGQALWERDIETDTEPHTPMKAAAF